MNPKGMVAGGFQLITLFRVGASLKGVLSGALLWLPRHFLSTYRTGCHLPACPLLLDALPLLPAYHSKQWGSSGNPFLPVPHTSSLGGFISTHKFKWYHYWMLMLTPHVNSGHRFLSHLDYCKGLLAILPSHLQSFHQPPIHIALPLIGHS